MTQRWTSDGKEKGKGGQNKEKKVKRREEKSENSTGNI